MRILLLNIRGSEGKKLDNLLRMLADFKVDIALLTETHTTTEKEANWKPKLGNTWNACFSHGDSNSRGVAILTKNSTTKLLGSPYKDNSGRLLTTLAKHNEETIQISSLYFPVSEVERGEWISSLNWNDLSQGIIGADFNVYHSQGDKLGGTVFSPKPSSRLLQRIEAEFKLIDPIILLDKSRTPTWIASSKKVATRLDRFLIPPTWTSSIKDIQIERQTISDHRPVILDLNLSQISIGPSYWKLNNTLINETTIAAVKQICKDIKKKSHLTHTQKWETIKLQTRSLFQKYGKLQAKLRDLKKEALNNKCRELEDKAASLNSLDPELKAILEKLASTQLQLNQLLEYHLEGARIRMRSKWNQYSEKNNKLWHALAKAEKRKSIIKELRMDIPEYKVCSLQEKAAVYYKALYGKKTSNSRAAKRLLKHTKRLNIFKDNINNLPTLEDFYKATSILPNNKSPGLDGLTTELYKKVPQLVKPLYKAWNESWKRKQLPLSTRIAVISCLYKKGDHNLISNYRPISLCNTDYKIIAKTLALQLSPYIATIVSEQQTGFIPKRIIHTNILQAKLAAQVAHAENRKGALIFFDFEKAFDRLNRSFLFKTLQSLGFPPLFIQSIETILSNTLASVIVNGWLSDLFQTYSGVRQGCPISPLLFAITTEPLQNTIMDNSHIQGLSIGDVTLKISLYADDTLAFVSSQEDAHHLMATMILFEKAASMKINLAKSHLLPINSEISIPGITRLHPSDSEPLLGSLICSQKDDPSIYNTPLEKMKSKIKKWNAYHLTIQGRALASNTSILPHFWYPCYTTSTPKTIIQEVYRSIWDFIQPCQPTQIPHIICHKTLQEGGINAPDIESRIAAIKCIWVVWIYNNLNTSWAQIWLYKARQILFKLNLDTFLGANLPESITQEGIVGESLYWWSQLPTSSSTWFDNSQWHADMADSTTLIYNKYISISKKLQTLLISSKIITLNDILNTDGTLINIPQYPTIQLTKKQWNQLTQVIPAKLLHIARQGNDAQFALNTYVERRMDNYQRGKIKIISQINDNILPPSVTIQPVKESTMGLLTIESHTPPKLITQDSLRAKYKIITTISYGQLHTSSHLTWRYGEAIDKHFLPSSIYVSYNATKINMLSMNQHIIYKILLESKFTNSIYSIPKEKQKSFKWLYKIDLPPRIKQFALRLFHNKLPWPDMACPFCPSLINNQHSLYQCLSAQMIGNSIAQYWKEIYPSYNPINPIWLDAFYKNKPQTPINILQITGKYSLWSTIWKHFKNNSLPHCSIQEINLTWKLKLIETLQSIPNPHSKQKKWCDSWFDSNGKLKAHLLPLDTELKSKV